ncbi:sporulation transcriptional regulator SpoIIID [Gallintestinimicrobium sp.]|uniref:sporulation transcriptional regulator SpoIIID n=1 Tax=Gallintestinimicrobium sp. TaxID=2981655 RepID=UPI0039927A94
MKEYIEERALAVAGYIIESNATVRQAARRLESQIPYINYHGRLMQFALKKPERTDSTIRAPYPRRYGNQGKI